MTNDKKYDVVCTMGWNHSVLNTIAAKNEKEAKDKVWKTLLDEDQRNNCEEIEVFLVE